MSRIKWFSHLLNDEGQPIEGANISIYLAGTETAATVYTSETGSNTISTAPQFVTNEDGYFEFWLADTSETDGYGADQKFKVAFEKAGVVDGYNDYISVFPNFVPIDLTSSDTSKDKTISNLYGKRWEEHRLDDSHTVHGILEVNLSSTDTVKNKLISNFNAYIWETHKDKLYNESPHDIEQADETSTDTTKNKLISNNQLYNLHTITDELSASINGSTYTEMVSASSLSTSGNYYYADILHNLDDEWVIPVLYDQSEREQVVPKDIYSIDSNSLRVWFNSTLDFIIKVNI